MCMRQTTTGTIERAYQIANTGTCHSVEDIIRRLVSEGFESPQAHLAGKSLRVELRRLIKIRRDAQAKPSTGGETEPSAAI